MNINQLRIEHLKEYVQGIMDQKDGKELYAKYKEEIEGVTPQEVFEIFYSQLQRGIEPTEVLGFLDKVINVFYKSLINYPWKRPELDSFIGHLLQENRALIERLDIIKELVKQGNLSANREELLNRVQELQRFNQHYLKKENILFPYLERKMEKFNGLAIMWALHDEVRGQLKKVIECLSEENCEEKQFNMEIGNLFFGMHGLIKKEELILFPAASEVIEEREWQEMQKQSLEYEFPFIEKPKEAALKWQDAAQDLGQGCIFKTETGDVSLEEFLMIFNTMPVDVTFVDENNKVRYYSDPRDRIFPRSPAIIGRSVEKCHPPQSVHVVNKIVETFRAGSKDSATFWIDLKGRKILIQYFALRDSKGTYKGVLEVSQDISEIIKLQGERRLLNWED